MKELYNRIFSNVVPKTSDNELLNAVISKNCEKEIKLKSKAFRRAVFVPVMAAIILSISILSVSAVYSGIQYLRANNKYTENENVAQSIKTQVYSDENEHVRLVVDELLSDNQIVYAVVHYEALSDVGKAWLANVEGGDLWITPRMEEHLNHYWSSEELEEYWNENERYYRLELTMSGDIKEPRIEFNYIMPDDSGNSVKVTSIVDISGSVKRLLYKLEGEVSPSEHYTPDCISVSNMTCTIYGFDNGCYEKNENGEMPAENPEFVAEIMGCKKYLVMSDSSKVEITTISGLTPSEPGEENNNTDFVIVGGVFSDAGIEPENVIGLEMDGIYYDLVPIE